MNTTTEITEDNLLRLEALKLAVDRFTDDNGDSTCSSTVEANEVVDVAQIYYTFLIEKPSNVVNLVR